MPIHCGIEGKRWRQTGLGDDSSRMRPYNELMSGGSTCCLCLPSTQSTLCRWPGYGNLSPWGPKDLLDLPSIPKIGLVADQNGSHALRTTTTGNHRSKVHICRRLHRMPA